MIWLLQERFISFHCPRRFGKSLLISTLESFFKGEEELLEKEIIYGTVQNYSDNNCYVSKIILIENW
jgi:hypothetical protein